MGKLILVRHGESVGNRERIFTRTPHELALTELGHRQARGAAHKIATLFRAELVVSSPFVRAHDTARIIAEILKLPHEVEHNLHERDVGSLKGQPYESVPAQPGYDPARPWLWQPPEGESFEDVRDRAAPVIDRLAATHRDGDVVVVSHGGVMVSLWAYVTGRWEGAPIPVNCGIVVVEHEAGRWKQPVVLFEQKNREESTGG